MADITKCFFQVLLPEKQQKYFCILSYKDDDVHRGQIESYKFTRHAWGVISSPYIVFSAIGQTAADNPSNASSHMTETVKGCMYMDNMLFSRDAVDEVQLVAKEAVELLDNRGFELIKWTACKKTKAIIAEMNGGNLAPPIRRLDLKTEEPLPDFKAVGCIWNAENDVLKIHFSLKKPKNIPDEYFSASYRATMIPSGIVHHCIYKVGLYFSSWPSKESRGMSPQASIMSNLGTVG